MTPKFVTLPFELLSRLSIELAPRPNKASTEPDAAPAGDIFAMLWPLAGVSE